MFVTQQTKSHKNIRELPLKASYNATNNTHIRITYTVEPV